MRFHFLYALRWSFVIEWDFNNRIKHTVGRTPLMPKWFAVAILALRQLSTVWGIHCVVFAKKFFLQIRLAVFSDEMVFGNLIIGISSFRPKRLPRNNFWIKIRVEKKSAINKMLGSEADCRSIPNTNWTRLPTEPDFRSNPTTNQTRLLTKPDYRPNPSTNQIRVRTKSD